MPSVADVAGDAVPAVGEVRFVDIDVVGRSDE